MRTYVFHFDTAQIHQGSCTALGDFLLKEEPHYAIEEALSKNTCKDLLLSASPQGQLERFRSAAARACGRAFPPFRPGSEGLLVCIHISPDWREFQKGHPWHLPEPLRGSLEGSDIGIQAEEVPKQASGVLYPKASSVPG